MSLTLYQREWCPYCTKVRRTLARLGLRYEVVNLPRLGTERTPVLERTGSPEVPVLQDGDEVIAGSEAILEHLEARYGRPGFGDPRHGLTRSLGKVSFDAAVEATTAALATEGFGVLTTIDVRATLKKKLDVDFPHYVILGACNPPIAHEVLRAEPSVGLLLPCNVVVAEDPDGSVIVSAVDPVRMLSVVDRDGLQEHAEEVRRRLARAVAAVEVPA